MLMESTSNVTKSINQKINVVFCIDVVRLFLVAFCMFTQLGDCSTRLESLEKQRTRDTL